MSEFAYTVNATEYPPHMKHQVIFETFDRLQPGQAMLLINDHDPVPLRYQFELERPGRFAWEYVERGPETFRVRIGRVEDNRRRPLVPGRTHRTRLPARVRR
ncbi:DUF2249 domain-containing protein [Alicyclobacillus macrosporangiidus]|uniref:Uncharacterized conserved protein, DUF2249 family n=1 Tax=Alicyclobacillus macrosporangiidus TaxID=392015 RepID=A0A1I7F4S2_9BACL|nr:Uncharacterized conserved protein, DUF2249 family [Alicyclobacillus macrosporangiidus]